MITKTKLLMSFGLHCPYCGRGLKISSIFLDLNNLTQCQCEGCMQDFTVAQAIKHATENARR
jgi:hypothetical protein